MEGDPSLQLPGADQVGLLPSVGTDQDRMNQIQVPLGTYLSGGSGLGTSARARIWSMVQGAGGSFPSLDISQAIAPDPTWAQGLSNEALADLEHHVLVSGEVRLATSSGPSTRPCPRTRLQGRSG